MGKELSKQHPQYKYRDPKDLLARGTFGSTYKAENKNEKTMVCMHVIPHRKEFIDVTEITAAANALLRLRHFCVNLVSQKSQLRILFRGKDSLLQSVINLAVKNIMESQRKLAIACYCNIYLWEHFASRSFAMTFMQRTHHIMW